MDSPSASPPSPLIAAGGSANIASNVASFGCGGMRQNAAGAALPGAA